MNTNNNLTSVNAGIYTDFDGLSRLRGQAVEKSPEANKEVSQQLEALFLQIMLKSMRDASQLSESTDSDQTRFYQDMFDKQIALDLASGQGIGMAAVIERQLSGITPSPQTTAPAITRSYDQAEPVTGKSFINSIEQNWKPENQKAFIKDLWPEAVNVAKKLDINPEVLIAQSALETGWGQKMITDQQGQNALNLFGIKADNGWQGHRVNVTTLEYRDGIAQKEVAAFRSYNSRAESMEDYVSFLKTSPRYQQALQSTDNAETYVTELQKAGYATDPAYADKINDIMHRDSFIKTVEQLKLSQASEKIIYRF